MPLKQIDPLPWYADPKDASVTDPLYLTLLRKAVGISGMDTPEGQVMQAAAPTPLMAGIKPIAEAASAVGTAVKGEAPKLVPYIVQMYKQRLASDPGLAYHPGLQMVPEFKQAFKEMYPNTRIVGANETSLTPKKTFTQILKATPTPPTATTAADALTTAQEAAGNLPKKPSKLMTVQELRAWDQRVKPGDPPTPPVTRPGKYSPQHILELSKQYETWPGNARSFAEKYGVPPGSLSELLSRAANLKEVK